MYVAFKDIDCRLPITSSVEYAPGERLWAQIKTGHYQLRLSNAERLT